MLGYLNTNQSLQTTKSLTTDSEILNICIDRQTDQQTDRPTHKQTDGFAAQAREELKEKKYKDKILVAGGRAKVIPLVLEHFGCWGWEAHKYTSITCLRNRLTNLARKTEASSRIIGGDAYQLLYNRVMLKFYQRRSAVK